MKSKGYYILMILIFIMKSANAQLTGHSKTVSISGFAGLKILHPKYFEYPVNVSPSIAPMLGAGFSIHTGNFQYGAEFSYVDGKKHNSNFNTILTGINFNLLAGYQRKLGKTICLIAQSGFGYNLSHLAVTNKTYTASSHLNTAIYHNLLYTIPISLTIQHVSENSNVIGIRVGYNFSAIPNEWRYMEGNHTEGYQLRTDGFYLQFVIGGFFK